MNLLWLLPPDISATKGHSRAAEHDITPISTARYCAASAIAFDLPHRARRTAAHDIGSESQAPNAHRPRAEVEITVNFIDIKLPIDVDAAVTCGRSEFQLLLPNFRPGRLVGSANPVSIGLVSTLFHPTVGKYR